MGVVGIGVADGIAGFVGVGAAAAVVDIGNVAGYVDYRTQERLYLRCGIYERFGYDGSLDGVRKEIDKCCYYYCTGMELGTWFDVRRDDFRIDGIGVGGCYCTLGRNVVEQAGVVEGADAFE